MQPIGGSVPGQRHAVADGIPATVIYDKQGRERARLSGGADWSTAQAKKVMDAVLAEQG